MSLLQTGEFWVGVGLLCFLGMLILLKVPSAAAKALDATAAKIQAELDEASRLREEAQALLASIKTQREAAEAAAVEMIANAEAQARQMEIDAKAKLEEQIARRQVLAERKIAAAEAAATAEVKAAAGELAANAAEAILTARLAGQKSDPLVGAAIDQLAGKFQ